MLFADKISTNLSKKTLSQISCIEKYFAFKIVLIRKDKTGHVFY